MGSPERTDIMPILEDFAAALLEVRTDRLGRRRHLLHARRKHSSILAHRSHTQGHKDLYCKILVINAQRPG